MSSNFFGQAKVAKMNNFTYAVQDFSRTISLCSGTEHYKALEARLGKPYWVGGVNST